MDSPESTSYLQIKEENDKVLDSKLDFLPNSLEDNQFWIFYRIPNSEYGYIYPINPSKDVVGSTKYTCKDYLLEDEWGHNKGTFISETLDNMSGLNHHWPKY